MIFVQQQNRPDDVFCRESKYSSMYGIHAVIPRRCFSEAMPRCTVPVLKRYTIHVGIFGGYDRDVLRYSNKTAVCLPTFFKIVAIDCWRFGEEAKTVFF